MHKMKENFKLTQLYKSSEKEFIKGTCHIHNSEDGHRFECSIKGDYNYKAQLWQWVNGNWNGIHGIECEVEFTNVNDVGLPNDGIITKIEDFLAI